MRVVLTFWRHIPLRGQIFAGFALPVVIVAGLSWIVELNLEAAATLSNKAERSMRAVTVRAELMKAVVDAETGERGFVITGNPAFLEPYERAQAQFAHAAREWQQLDDGETSDLATVQQLFRSWQDEVAKPAIAARQKAPAGLFSASFEALHHLTDVREWLARPAAERGAVSVERLTQFYPLLQRAVALGTHTENATQWLQAGVHGEQLRQQLTQLTTATTEAPPNATQLSQQLAKQLGELTYRVRTTEEAADNIVASGRGKELVDQIRALVAQSIAEKEHAHALLGADVRQRMQLVQQLSLVLPVAGVGLGLALLLLMQLDTIRSIEKLRLGAQRIAEGNLDARIAVHRTDELGALGHGFNRMAQQLQLADREMRLLDQLQAMLISSSDENEAFAAVKAAAHKLLPHLSGALYVLASSRDFAEIAVSWGADAPPVVRFHPEDCRALRIGRLHQVSDDSAALHCPHTDAAQTKAALCIPLVTRDEQLGILAFTSMNSFHITPHERNLAATVAERLALALSNMRLAEKLRRQSIRDPLTGLFNRRYLEETFERELARAERANDSLAVVALDVDHFKRCNDTFGHEAGDLVLKELAGLMTTVIRPADIPCRFGGEEFLLVLPQANAEVARNRAELLRQHVESLQLSYAGNSLGHITISLGVSVYPQHTMKRDELLRLADNALYVAKRQGRNQVVVSGEAS